MAGRKKTPEKEARILAAAAGVFSAKDFHEVRMEEVAARAGVGKGTIYRYFPAKDDLYFATIFAGLEGLHAEIQALTGRGERLRDTLEAIATGLLRYFWSRRPLLTLLHRYELRLRGPQGAAWLERRRAIASEIGGVFARAMQNGQIAGVDSRFAAELFLGMVRAANVYRSERDAPEDLGRRIASVLLDGLSRRAQGGAGRSSGKRRPVRAPRAAGAGGR